MVGLIVVLVVLDALVLLGVIVGAISLKKYEKVAGAAEAMLNDIRRELPATLQAAQVTLKQLQRTAEKTESELDRVDDILRSVDRLVSGAMITNAAACAMRSSRTTLASVIAGLKEGLRVLKTPGAQTKEE